MKYILSLLFVVASLLGFAQKTSYDYIGAWYIYNGFFKFSPKIEFFFEAQSRNYEVVSNPEAFFLRPYLTYNLNKNVQFGASTEYHKHFSFDTGSDLKISREEFRVGLQAIVNQPLEHVFLQHRYRYEFRNINSVGGNRIRYRVQVTLPLNFKKAQKGGMFFNTNNELFVNVHPGWSFDQNRFFMAFGYYFSRTLNLQLGYMFISDQEGTDQRIQVFLTQKLDFQKE